MPQMHAKSLTTLEYPKILERLAQEAAFSASKDLVLALQPSGDRESVRRSLACTSEARRLLEQRPETGVRGARDVRPHAAAAERGVVLSPADLVDVLATLRSSTLVARLMQRLEGNFPLLRALLEDLPVRTKLEERISGSISEEGEVLDAASPLLRRLRAEMRAAQQRLHERLGTLVSEYRGALQEPIITMRADRYVLPVRAEARSQVRGIVHDQSGSGATVFIEPLVVVEMNNRLRELGLDERREVERILRELSEAVGEEAPYIRLAVDLLAQFDLRLAMARFAGLLRATEPRVSDDGRLHLRQARHPLLSGRVVPIDVWLDGETPMVVITGPNTGGKTVALKTVGLLCLMAQAGLHLPVEEDSIVPVYTDIFADIGDEQSIEQSLSTFSSHLTRIVEILRLATPDALVLLDELGAGTDPSEGAALAHALLEHLLQRHIATIATTHYSELKVFAHERAGAVNASVEFDVETLSPTYRLSIGLPGRSNALAIAARLGLPEPILEQARGFLGTAGVEMEGLLHGLQHERTLAAEERFQLSMERAEAEHQRRELERERAEAAEERDQLLNAARTEARRELEALRADLAHIRTQAKREQLSPEQLATLRAQVRRLDERASPLPTRTRRHAAPLPEADAPVDGPLAVGDAVFVGSIGRRGELLTLPNARDEVEVQIGALKTRVPRTEVQRLSKRQARASEVPAAVHLPTREDAPEPELQLDLRGWRVEDALEEVERYLDNALLAGMPLVRLLHGKGTGALRQAIRQQLARHPGVRSAASAAPNDGGDGVTIVTLDR